MSQFKRCGLAIGFVAMTAIALALSAAETPSQQVSERIMSAPMLDFGKSCERPIPDSEAARLDTTQTKPPRPAAGLTMPDYPPFARRMEQEGTVMLQIYITDQGEVGQARVAESSGWPRLDDAAMNGVREWRFVPGEWRGKTACMWVTVPIVYRLTDYTRDELLAAQISTQAESLSRILLGDTLVQSLVSKASQSDQANADDQVAGQILAILSARPEWRESLHDIAAMLSIEFSPDEAAELEKLLTSPVMQKYLGVHRKLQPEIARRQQHFGSLAYCTASFVADASQLTTSDILEGWSLPPKAIDAIPRIAKETEPYCKCAVEMTKNTKNIQVVQQKCGARPKVSL